MSNFKDLPQCSKTLPPPPGLMKYGLNPKVVSAMKRVQTWSEDEKFELTCEIIKSFEMDKERFKKVMNLARGFMDKAKQHPTNDKKEVCGQQRNVDSEASGRVGSGYASKLLSRDDKEEVCGQQRNVDPGASVAEASVAAPATQVPMICRGDLLTNSTVLFFDTEKVTIAHSHENKSGDMAIVDMKGRLLFWTFIRQENVCKFNTKLSGLDESKMAMGLSVETVKEILSKLLYGKELWGASTFDDAKSLGFTSGFFPTSSSTNDIQSFYRDYKDRPIGLGILSEHFLGGNVQNQTHSAITDARLTALCYRKMLKFQAIGMTRFNCPVMDELRKEKKKCQWRMTNVHVVKLCQRKKSEESL